MPWSYRTAILQQLSAQTVNPLLTASSIVGACRRAFAAQCLATGQIVRDQECQIGCVPLIHWQAVVHEHLSINSKAPSSFRYLWGQNLITKSSCLELVHVLHGDGCGL